MDHIRQHNISVHSLLIVRNGYLILDAHFFPFDGRSVHDVASVTKSVTSTLIGAAINEGKIKAAQQPVVGLFPDAIANLDERKRRLTIEHLLTMSSGVECQPRENELTLRQMKESSNWTRYMLDLPMADEPGRKFVYCSGGMHLLSAILSRTTGLSAHDFADRSLFKLLGIHEVIWPSDPQGVSYGWGDLHLLPRDMAKIGYLWLNHGTWEGRQILSADWMKEAVRSHVPVGPDGGYGYGVWVRPIAQLYEALGRGGQRISIVPTKNLVIVFTGGGFEPGDIGKYLVGAVTADHPLPENRAGVSRLLRAVEDAALRPARKAVPPPPTMAAKVSGKNYIFKDNPLGLKSIVFNFSAENAAHLKFTFSDKRFTSELVATRAVGLDGVARISAAGRFGLPVGIKGFWQDETTFVIDYDEIANINNYRFVFKFGTNELTVELTEKTGTAKLKLEATPVRAALTVHDEVPFR